MDWGFSWLVDWPLPHVVLVRRLGLFVSEQRGQAANGTVPITPPYRRAFVPPATLCLKYYVGPLSPAGQTHFEIPNQFRISRTWLASVQAALIVLPQRDTRGAAMGRASRIDSTSQVTTCG